MGLPNLLVYPHLAKVPAATTYQGQGNLSPGSRDSQAELVSIYDVPWLRDGSSRSSGDLPSLKGSSGCTSRVLPCSSQLLCCREGNLSTKQIVFLQRPCLPQKTKKRESKVRLMRLLCPPSLDLCLNILASVGSVPAGPLPLPNALGAQ